MHGKYLHKWASAIEGIEELVITEWSQTLAGLTGEQISKGIENLPEGWPPDAITFRSLCQGKQVNGLGLDYRPPYHCEFKRETLLESDENKAKHKAAAKAGMSNIKDILKGK